MIELVNISYSSQKPFESESSRITSGRSQSEITLSAFKPVSSSGREYDMDESFFCQPASASGAMISAGASIWTSNSTYLGRAG